MPPTRDLILATLGECDPIALPMLSRAWDRDRAEVWRAACAACREALGSQQWLGVSVGGVIERIAAQGPPKGCA